VNRPTPGIACSLIAVIVGTAVEGTPRAQAPATAAEHLLQHRMALSAQELRELRAGAAVVKSLESGARQELAHLGVVGIHMRSDEFVTRFRDIERFERGPGIPQIGRFSDPPRLADLASLTLPIDDVKALQTCRPGDCDVKLSAEGMNRVRAQVNWTSPDATRQANDAMRRLLLDLVLAYQARGNEALGHHDDRTTSLPIAEEFKALLAQPNIVPVPVQSLLSYLRDFPRNRPHNAEEFFYWSLVTFGLKPTIRINHVVLYPLTGAPSNVPYVIATKQVYASHYFHTTLELRFLLNQSAAVAPGFYLLSIVRSRNDGMTGFSGSLLRPIISRRSRTGVRRYLEYVKRQMEQ
jgi:hypothetical protein